MVLPKVFIASTAARGIDCRILALIVPSIRASWVNIVESAIENGGFFNLEIEGGRIFGVVDEAGTEVYIMHIVQT